MTTLKKVKTCPIITRPIPKYYPNDVVYAVSFSNEDDNKHKKVTSEWDMNYARIYKVIIIDINISITGISYWLKDAKSKAEWGDSVPEFHVNTDINVLLQFLINKWKL